jgi:hypothetical protein
MSSLKEFRCEICGTVSENPIHWFVIECTDQRLAVIKWDPPPQARRPGISAARPTPRPTSADGLNPCASRPANTF